MPSNFASFTITQPFLGAPLQFQPALGSKELDQLIDAFVTGSVSKKDKLSEVTIDFYNNATVDLNTGALVRRYDVALSPWQSFEQSPISQSSSFSPPIFTPSPASSATFGDSGYGSISMTPPNRNRGRVSKKPAKKDTNKAAEARLPGFSIMTKDGIDVTSSAGRGTKTKEQREHAHLMRIMKACDDCKRKKIRCDPSHRRSHTDMSRSSTSTTKSSSSFSRVNPSPPAPSLTHEATTSSYESLPSYGTLDDFVLFPEDTASWNAPDMSLSFDQGTDLSQFDFDINGIDFDSMADQSFDFSSFEPSPSLQQPAYTPLTTDQFGLDQWAGAWGGQTNSHARPHHSASAQDSGQLDSSYYSSGSLGDSPVSPRTNAPVPHGTPYSSLGHSQSLRDNSLDSTNQAVSSSLEWSLNDSSSFATISPHANQDLSAPGKGKNRKERRHRKRASNEKAVQELVDSVPSRYETQTDTSSLPLSVYEPAFSDSPSEGYDQTLSPASLSSSSTLSSIERTYVEVQESLHILQSSPAKDQSLSGELLQLRHTVDLVSQYKKDSMGLGVTAAAEAILDDLNSQLQALSANVIQQRYDQLDSDTRQQYVRQCQVTARRLVRSLCATISSLQAQHSSSSPTDTTISSGNSQFLVSLSSRNSRGELGDYSTQTRENSQGGSGVDSEFIHSHTSTISSSSRYGVVLREDGVVANDLLLADTPSEGAYAIGLGGNTAVATLGQTPRFTLAEKENVYDLQRQSPVSANDDSLSATEMATSRSRANIGHSETASGVASLLRIAIFQDRSASALPSCHPLSTRSDFAQENSNATPTTPITVANIAPSQQQQQRDQPLSTISENLVQLSSPLQVMLSRTDGSSRSASVPFSVEASSRGAIPRSVLEQQNTPVVANDSPRVPELPAGGFDMKYSMLVALALSASLVTLNILQATQSGILNNLMPLFLPLALLAVAYPRQFSSTALSSVFIPLVALTSYLALSSIPRVQLLREYCNQWIDTNPFTASMKLLLCCAIAAQPSNLWGKITGLRSLAPVATAASLLHFSCETSSIKTSSHQLPKGIQGRNVASLFELLSPVQMM